MCYVIQLRIRIGIFWNGTVSQHTAKHQRLRPAYHFEPLEDWMNAEEKMLLK
ncbi:hypothetical protein BVRB_2g034530 [Beta vulgaris subsp. vulgaris]|nr:hypothetical protein BVRB_2g034530 [Beta vulgaris subsp. vulgaris]